MTFLFPSFSLLEHSNGRMGIKTYGEDPFVSIGLEVPMKIPYLKKISLDICFFKISPVLFTEPTDSHPANPIVSCGDFKKTIFSI